MSVKLEWSKNLLGSGARRTQKEWIEWCNSKENKEGWRLPTVQEYITLLESKEGKRMLEKLRELSQYVMTLTEVPGIEWVIVLSVYSGTDQVCLYAIDDVTSRKPAFGVKRKMKAGK